MTYKAMRGQVGLCRELARAFERTPMLWLPSAGGAAESSPGREPGGNEAPTARAPAGAKDPRPALESPSVLSLLRSW
jgi:hypothetical protein